MRDWSNKRCSDLPDTAPTPYSRIYPRSAQPYTPKEIRGLQNSRHIDQAERILAL